MTKHDTTSEQTPPCHDPIAIVGIGCLFPKADSPEAFWANIAAGVDAISEIPESHWKASDYFDADPSSPDMTYAQRGGFIEPVDFDPLRFGISPNNIEATDTTQLLGMWVAAQALRDAGYSTGQQGDTGRPFDRDRTSVILGVTGTLELVIPLGARLGHPIWRQALADAGIEKRLADEVVERIADGYVPWQENSFPGLLGNVAAGRIANRFDLGGTNCVVDAACASSLSAIHMATMELQAGRSDMVVTGGLDTFNDIFMYMCFSKTPALSPTGNARPFSDAADGTILGEGLGVVVLRRLSDARRDGDRIVAVIRSIGTSSDGRGNAVYAPSAAGQTKALRDAYKIAGVSPGSIELVEAHGTGTEVGDAVEIRALAEVYRQDRPQGTWCALGSVKSMIGHTKAAAGVAGLIKTALALRHKVLPPTIKVDRPAEAITPGKAPVYVNTESRPWLPREEHRRRAGLSAFGFGGSNFHCVLEEAEPAKTHVSGSGDVQILAFSGSSLETLREQIKRFDAGEAWPRIRRQAARCREAFRASDECRLLMVVEKDGSDPAKMPVKNMPTKNMPAENMPVKMIAAALQQLATNRDKTSWSTPDGIYFAAGKPAGKLAVVFPGQGSQRVGMLRDLACQFPEMLDALAQADDAYGESESGRRLSDRIYPIPVFDPHSAEQLETTLRDTSIAQPALGAVSLGAYRVLQRFGVSIDGAAGHSFGELVALCAAGRIEPSEMHRLAAERGRLMAAGSGDRGSMLAVAAPLSDVQAVIESEKLDLVVANQNGPRQMVLSGATDDVERAKGLFSAQGVAAKRLAVSAAFHSRFVADAETAFAEALAGVTFAQGQTPVMANTTAAIYPQSSAEAKTLLAGQLARPVLFAPMIEQMIAGGVRTFVEVGPDRKLGGLIRAIGESIAERAPGEPAEEIQAISLDSSRGGRRGEFDLAMLLAHIAATGQRIDLPRWDAQFAGSDSASESAKPGMSIKLCGANHVMPRKSKPARQPTSAVATVAASSAAPKPTIQKQETASPTQSSRPTALTTPSQPADTQPALEATRQSILALQKMQQQTADLHRQYLEGQAAAQQTIASLLEGQQRLFAGSSPIAPPAPVTSAPVISAPVTPAPAIVQPPQPAPVVEPLPLAAATPTPKPTPPQSAVPPIPAAPSDSSHIALLEVVAEKTGYPVEMLDLDMGLDTDLGIDSIKRVEILSALQERLPDAPMADPDDLGRLETLRQIVDFLDGLSSGQQTVSGANTSQPPEMATQTPPQQVAGKSKSNGDMVSADAAVVLEVVAEKTGYPVEMLELDMNLDADLGIDSIKRVEILSAVQERLPDAPVVNPDELATLQTLRQVVDFLQQTAMPAEPQAEVANVPTAPQSNEADPVVLAAPLASVEAELSPSSRLDDLICHEVTATELDLDAPRGRVAISPAGRFWIVNDGTGLAESLSEALASVAVTATIIAVDSPPANDDLSGMLVLSPPQADDAFVAAVFALLQHVAPALRGESLGTPTILATVSRLGGAFGLDRTMSGNSMSGNSMSGNPMSGNPIGGALAGLLKTAALEWPEVRCKALDVSDDFNSTADLAHEIVSELLLDGPVEVGIRPGSRCEICLVDRPRIADVDDDVSWIESGDTIVLSGGARGVTAEVAVALAETYGAGLLLLGRSPEPAEEPDWASGLSDEIEIKRAIAAASNSPLTPKSLEFQYRRIASHREITANLARIEQAGGRAIYRSLDVRDADAVARAVAEARAHLGPIRGIVHGAGVLADRKIEDKTAQQFAEVYSTKVDGLRALLQATETDDLRAIALFSSSTARFGRRGQSDYAAANEMLNKMAGAESRRRGECRVASINWGPWDGGMVNSQLKAMFRGEGVGVIGRKAGAQLLLQQMARPASAPVEIVVLGPVPDEGATAATVPPTIAQTSAAVSSSADTDAQAAMRVTSSRDLNVDAYPLLRSHVVGGRAVLPMAVIIEWLAHGAMHDHPGLMFAGFDDLRVFKGITLDADESRKIEVWAGPSRRDGSLEVVRTELRCGEVLHAGATIVLAMGLRAGKPSKEPIAEKPYAKAPAEIYTSSQLFHGPMLEGIESIDACDKCGIIAQVSSAGPPSTWMREPMRSAWLADPLVLDASFQMMILWCFDQCGRGSLPTSVRSYRQMRRSMPAAGMQVLARITAHREHTAEASIEFLDRDGALVARIEGYECVIDASLEAAFAQNELTQQVEA